MPTGAAFYVNMVGFNKQDITSDFPARHISYILNRNKVREVGSLNAPSNYYQAQDWLTAHYSAGRKNARVWTRFILNLPHDLSHAQRVALIKSYLGALSQGRAQFLWAVHDDTAAPHAHVVYVDKDIHSGRRVAQLTERSSVHRWRKVWEDCCNRALSLAGSVARVSRLGKHSQHHYLLNAEAQRERSGVSETADPPAASQCPQKPPLLQRRGELEPIIKQGEPHVERDTVMDAIIKQDAQTPSIAAVVAFVASQVLELERLRAAKQTIADYRAAYAQVTANLLRTQTRMESIDPELQRAGARVIKAEQEEARHKGLLKRLWQMVSPGASSRAKAAKTAAQMAVYALSTTRIKANSLLREAQALEAEQKALHEKANALKSSLAIYGTDEDVVLAEQALIRTIAVNTAELSATELSHALLTGEITPDEHRHLLRAVDKGGLEN